MKPTPQKLALLVSLAGVGLSLGETVHAESDRPAHAHRLEGPAPPAHGALDLCAPGALDAMCSDAYRWPLDRAMPEIDQEIVAAAREAFQTEDASAIRKAATMLRSDAPVLPSKADRDAIALAMVSIADPPWSVRPAQATPPDPVPLPGERDTRGTNATVAPRQMESPAIAIEALEWNRGPRDDLREATSPEHEKEPDPESSTVLTQDPGRAADDSGASAAADAMDARAVASSALDLDVSAGPSPNLGEGFSSVAGLDLNLDLSADLDLNLNLGVGVDVELEFGSPPGYGTADGLQAGLGSTPDLNLGLGTDFLLDLNTGRAWKEAPVKSMRSPNLSTVAPSPPMSAAAVSIAPPGVPTATPPLTMAPDAATASRGPATAVRARPGPSVAKIASDSCVADEPAPASRVPQIVVATHSERVLRSLEALISHREQNSPWLGAQTEEIFVATEAEKTSLLLASLRNRSPAPLKPDTGVSHSGVQLDKTTDAPPASAQAQRTPLPPLANAAGMPREESLPKTDEKQRPAVRSPIGDGVLALNESKLDQVRGGFVTNNGLQISFGIERAVYINGNLVTTTSLNVSDMGKVTAGQTPSASVSTALNSAVQGGTTLIQNGAGSTFQSGPVSAASLGTVIQNTLNNQKIQSLTLVNATVNSLQMLKAQNFQSSLRSALIDSLRR